MNKQKNSLGSLTYYFNFSSICFINAKKIIRVINVN